MIGLGTIINVVAIVIGASLGVLLGHRLPERTRTVVTDGLGLLTLVIAAFNIVSLTSSDWSDAVGNAAPILIVLGAVVIGGVLGSLLGIERRLEQFGGWFHRKVSRSAAGDSRFVDAFVDTSLLYCIGPLAVLGSFSDGLRQGIEQLVLKSGLDLFASVAFAASMGWGVAASALSVGAVQGLLTLISALVGPFLSAAMVASITATGGVLLIGVGLRILNIRAVPVGDLLPAILVAPILTWVVASFM